MKQQTAVEWLKSKVLYIVPSSQKEDLLRLFEQAEQMEKDQIMKTWEDRVSKLPEPKGYMIDFTSAEQYYNGTYGGESDFDKIQKEFTI